MTSTYTNGVKNTTSSDWVLWSKDGAMDSFGNGLSIQKYLRKAAKRLKSQTSIRRSIFTESEIEA